MHTHIKIFKCNLIKCIEDCIDILQEMKSDNEASTLLSQLKAVHPIVNSLPESGLVDIINEIYVHTLPLRDSIKKRDPKLFETETFASLDVKTFKSIKKIIQSSKQDDVDCMYDYIDSFIASCDKYRMDTKMKLQ